MKWTKWKLSEQFRKSFGKFETFVTSKKLEENVKIIKSWISMPELQIFNGNVKGAVTLGNILWKLETSVPKCMKKKVLEIISIHFSTNYSATVFGFIVLNEINHNCHILTWKYYKVPPFFFYCNNNRIRIQRRRLQ